MVRIVVFVSVWVGAIKKLNAEICAVEGNPRLRLAFGRKASLDGYRAMLKN